MSMIWNSAFDFYYFLTDEIKDPRTQDWFLISSPWPGLCILILYLFAVKLWLPNYMKHRPAFEIQGVLIIYNVVQIYGCVYITYKSLTLGWLKNYKLICQGVDEDPDSLEFIWTVCYGYFFLKLLDLLDTIFFVLRKKQNQVTFLHVYHHFWMVVMSWGIVKWVPGGHGTSILTLNCITHTVMYTYYLLSAWDDKYKRSVWWKKHVTQLQMVQQVLIILHLAAALLTPDCAYPSPPCLCLIPQTVFMLILFFDFYRRTYNKPKKLN